MPATVPWQLGSYWDPVWALEVKVQLLNGEKSNKRGSVPVWKPSSSGAKWCLLAPSPCERTARLSLIPHPNSCQPCWESRKIIAKLHIIFGKSSNELHAPVPHPGKASGEGEPGPELDKWLLWVSRAKRRCEVVGTWLKLRLGKPVLEKEEFLQSTVNHIGRASFGGD